MIFHSPSLIQRLQELQQQIADAPRYGESLQAAWEKHDVRDVVCTTIDAERHLRAIRVTTAHIKAQVVPVDGLGDMPELLSELVFRAVRMVLLAELTTLRDVLCEPSARARLRELLREPVRSIDDLTSCPREELHRITHEWSASRYKPGIERAAYRAALREVSASIRELGNASHFARFLREESDRTDWPALREVCVRMRGAFTIRIDVDLDLR
jgi:hypothetical protein